MDAGAHAPDVALAAVQGNFGTLKREGAAEAVHAAESLGGRDAEVSQDDVRVDSRRAARIAQEDVARLDVPVDHRFPAIRWRNLLLGAGVGAVDVREGFGKLDESMPNEAFRDPKSAFPI